MGEIGRDRHEFLYEMAYWEILLIVRGYNRRNVLQYQLQRIQACWALWGMNGNKDGKTPEEMIPLWFDRLKRNNPDADYIAENKEQLEQEMAAYQRFLDEKAKNE